MLDINSVKSLATLKKGSRVLRKKLLKMLMSFISFFVKSLIGNIYIKS
jgi:hypothetical protein